MSLFSGIRIRHKLLLFYSLLYTISLTIGFTTVYLITRENIRSNIESELHNTTTALYNLVRTSAAVSIKNYLRGAGEKNIEILNALYRDYQNGLCTEEEAKARATHILLSQTIGESGYIYCLDSKGMVVLHPQEALVGENVAGFAFVRALLQQKRGYLEYDWQNPGEEVARPKALYVLHFAPWDWYLAVSSYRAEFRGLINVDDFKESVLDLRFGRTGYAFVINHQGEAIIHPKLAGVNILNYEGVPNAALATMIREKQGQILYPWKNPDDVRARIKLCLFSDIEEYDWIVGASSYQEEFDQPLQRIRTLFLLTCTVTLVLVLVLTFWISDSITSPLKRLMEHFRTANQGDFSARLEVDSGDEIGQLARYFNRYMEQLSQYSSSLRRQIQVRQDAENSLRESEERYRSVMEAAADPIVIYDMLGQVTYFNPAFQRVFGWSLKECLGRKMDHFVPQENWPETQKMIDAVNRGEVLPATETKRLTKSGDIRTVSISGAAFRGHREDLAGTVVILRDITETKQLTKQLMDIDDRVRLTIGQDLHDDLCPHLIGIGGLASALQATITEQNTAGAALAGRIVDLIGSATDKARGLARGLCPVHVVKYGLQSALAELASHTTASSGITCVYQGDDRLEFTDNAMATHLYYIAQEAVCNAVKHAGAQRITISLEQDRDLIHLRIIDDGCGVGPLRQGAGIGLQIMRHRALVIGAFLEVAEAREKGTSMHLYLKPSADGQGATSGKTR